MTPCTVACQSSLSVGFSRREYWSGLPSPFVGNLPNPGLKATSPALAGRFLATREAQNASYNHKFYGIYIMEEYKTDHINTILFTPYEIGNSHPMKLKFTP